MHIIPQLVFFLFDLLSFVPNLLYIFLCLTGFDNRRDYSIMEGKISLTFTMKYMYQEVVNVKEI